MSAYPGTTPPPLLPRIAIDPRAMPGEEIEQKFGEKSMSGNGPGVEPCVGQERERRRGRSGSADSDCQIGSSRWRRAAVGAVERG
jgi:hypothetical protein